MISILAASVLLSWDITEGAVSYMLYAGQQPIIEGNPPAVVFLSEDTFFEMDGLDFGITYFFVATAYNECGIEGPFSNQVEYTPVPPPEPTPTATPEPTPTPDPTATPTPGRGRGLHKGWYK